MEIENSLSQMAVVVGHKENIKDYLDKLLKHNTIINTVLGIDGFSEIQLCI